MFRTFDETWPAVHSVRLRSDWFELADGRPAPVVEVAERLLAHLPGGGDLGTSSFDGGMMVRLRRSWGRAAEEVWVHLAPRRTGSGAGVTRRGARCG